MAIQTKNKGYVLRKYISDIFVRKSEEIQYLFSRNFAHIQVLRENARKFVRAKISTNKVWRLVI